MASVSSAATIAAQLTAAEEGFSASPYFDVDGYAIGYGNHYYEDGTAVSADDDPITEARATQLMQFFLNQTAGEVLSLLTVPVSDNMLAALTDLAYNWGFGNLKKSVLLSFINQGAGQDTIQAQWKITAITAGGIQNSDLVTRRARESNLAFSSLPGAAAVLTAGIGSDSTVILIIAIFATVIFLSTRKSII